MIRLQVSIILLAAVLFPISIVPVASAQSSFNVKEIFSIEGQKTTSDIVETAKEKNISPVAAVLLKTIDILARVIATFAFLGLVVSGLILVTSHGNEQQITKGKTVMVYSFVGLIVALLSFILITSIQALFI